jgi:hypothetical protein
MSPNNEQDAYRAFQSFIIGHGKRGRAFFVQQYLSLKRADPVFADGFYRDTASKLPPRERAIIDDVLDLLARD